MKKILLTALSVLAFYCTPKKGMVKPNSESKIVVTNTNCPPDGQCEVSVLKNQKLVIKTDDLGGIYFETTTDTNYSVIKYTYQKTVEKELQDASYKEEIIFEIKNYSKDFSLANQEMQQTKILFGRHCYCKGQAGYFRINSGMMTSHIIKDKTEYTINFKITQVPQILKSISFLIP